MEINIHHKCSNETEGLGRILSATYHLFVSEVDAAAHLVEIRARMMNAVSQLNGRALNSGRKVPNSLILTGKKLLHLSEAEGEPAICDVE